MITSYLPQIFTSDKSLAVHQSSGQTREGQRFCQRNCDSLLDIIRFKVACSGAKAYIGLFKLKSNQYIKTGQLSVTTLYNLPQIRVYLEALQDFLSISNMLVGSWSMKLVFPWRKLGNFLLENFSFPSILGSGVHGETREIIFSL